MTNVSLGGCTRAHGLRDRRPLVLVVATVMACHPTASAMSNTVAPASAAAPPTADLPVPARLQGYTLRGSEPVGESYPGTVYHFGNGSDTDVGVIVYPVTREARRGSDAQHWVTHEGELFQQVLPDEVQRGWIEGYHVVRIAPAPVTSRTLTIPGHVTTVVTRRPAGDVWVEFQYLYMIRGSFLKVRASVPERAWPQTDVPQFAKTLALAVAGRD